SILAHAVKNLATEESITCQRWLHFLRLARQDQCGLEITLTNRKPCQLNVSGGELLVQLQHFSHRRPKSIHVRNALRSGNRREHGLGEQGKIKAGIDCICLPELGFSLRIVTFVEIKESHIFMGQTTPRIVLESCFEKRSRSGGIMSPEVESAEFRFGFRGCSHADSEILFADLRRAFDHSGGEHLTYR